MRRASIGAACYLLAGLGLLSIALFGDSSGVMRLAPVVSGSIFVLLGGSLAGTLWWRRTHVSHDASAQ